MKKTFLLFALGATVFSAKAQLTLPATGPYSQDFTTLPTYPTGWSTYNKAITATSLGVLEAIQYVGQSLPSAIGEDTATGTCIGGVLVGGFKNFPSANVAHAGDDYCGPTPPTYTDRALGVRQVGNTNPTHPDLDPGASFVLRLANTGGHANFVMNFKLQSLDTGSERITTWAVQYSTGSSINFVDAVTTGTMTTGGHVFSNNPISVNFGTALDNKNNNVYIRIVAKTASTIVGASTSGRRASTAIDDVTLTYTNVPNSVNDVNAANGVALTVVGAPATDKVTFDYDVAEAGNYNFAIYDLAGRMMHTQQINANGGAQSLTVSGLNLVPGMYVAKMFNSNASSVVKMIVQ